MLEESKCHLYYYFNNNECIVLGQLVYQLKDKCKWEEYENDTVDPNRKVNMDIVLFFVKERQERQRKKFRDALYQPMDIC
ncbi:hypothetical protein MTR_4g093160 [Medicago truncatula]|uniref:Uncharacterized protein n=1 Tax=Medicago truncatula TaxID=3880 RepID=G7JU34_MEDTR|nr:hypothetical protein MTR_4g093160 [Medicago truncatula]